MTRSVKLGMDSADTQIPSDKLKKTGCTLRRGLILACTHEINLDDDDIVTVVSRQVSNIYLRNKDTQQMKKYFLRSYMMFAKISPLRMCLLTLWHVM